MHCCTLLVADSLHAERAQLHSAWCIICTSVVMDVICSTRAASCTAPVNTNVGTWARGCAQVLTDPCLLRCCSALTCGALVMCCAGAAGWCALISVQLETASSACKGRQTAALQRLSPHPKAAGLSHRQLCFITATGPPDSWWQTMHQHCWMGFSSFVGAMQAIGGCWTC
jgi:hypothetical protein